MMEKLAENLWVLRFPLSMIGIQEGRTVTIFRLSSGDLVIHSTAPFSPEDVETIAAVGRPAWLLDATLFHDTYADPGRAAFPALPYLAPARFPVKSGPVRPLTDLPAEWSPELEVLQLEGMPRVREHLFFHRPSRTLVVADLVFNFDRHAPLWTRAFFRYAAGLRHYPGVS